MLKIGQLIGLLFFYLSANAQKAFYYQENAIDLNKFKYFYIMDSPILIENLTSPFLDKNSLDDNINRYFILYNELSLKNLTVIDAIGGEETIQVNIHTNADYLCGCAISSNYYKKKKPKNGDLVIDVIQSAGKTLLWRGWIDLKKIKAKNTYLLYKKAIYLILFNFKTEPAYGFY